MHLTGRTNIITLAAAGLLATVGVGWAAIPDSDGTVHGCYATSSGGLLLGPQHSKGDTRIVDSGETCRFYEKRLTWSQRGPQGLPGKDGINGTNGTDGTDGTDGEDGTNATALWASVAADATLTRGSHAVKVERPLLGAPHEGRYDVTFDRDVSRCAYTATVGSADTEPLGISNGNVIRVSTAYELRESPVPIPGGVRVTINDLDGGNTVAQPFFLAVHC